MNETSVTLLLSLRHYSSVPAPLDHICLGIICWGLHCINMRMITTRWGTGTEPELNGSHQFSFDGLPFLFLIPIFSLCISDYFLFSLFLSHGGGVPQIDRWLLPMYKRLELQFPSKIRWWAARNYTKVPIWLRDHMLLIPVVQTILWV